MWWLQLHYLVIKEPIIIFHLKGHAVKLKCFNYEIFWKNMIFAKKQTKTKQNKNKNKNKNKKNASFKLENIHNLDTYFHPLRNIVLKLFANVKQSMWNFKMGLIFKKLYLFMRQLCPFLKDKM